MIAESIWHDVENGAYAADLALWEEFAAQAAGPVLELGAGTGRVALELAGHGHDVVALDDSAELLAVLRERAAADGVEVDTVVANARSFSLGRTFPVILAPMQFAHIIGGAGGRAEMLASVASHLEGSGTFAAALLDDEALAGQTTGPQGSPPPLPDVREIDGWVYSSLPFEVADVPGGVEIRRLRQAVSPSGDLDEETEAIRLDVVSEDDFEREAAEHGLMARERIPIPATADHVGSTVCVFEVAR